MLILASQSPRRKELLEKLKIPFIIRVSGADESMDPFVPPEDEVARLSYGKAMAIDRQPEDIVIAADTIVVLDGRVLGKPADEADALDMLQRLSGRSHQVMTGVTVLRGERAITHTEITHVHFRHLTREEMQRYVATGEPMDKAGSYGIQGGAALFCERMVGDYYNVMGLPVCRLGQVLKTVAPELMEDHL